MNSKLVLYNILRWVILLFVQIFLLRNSVVYDIPTPFIYCLVILVFPFKTPNILLYLMAFLTGLTIDAFYDTLGVHTAACIAMAFVRILFISVSLNREAIDEPEPSLGNMGFKWFSIYSLLCILTHHLLFFYLEAFKFSEFFYTLGRALISTVVSFFLILLIEFIFHNKKAT
ncbi:MAG: rod shape-determining protein MreD [Pedobacter sp.]|nr:MAG: rod shape-determining protein MreD [Pedobacter sp.]